MPIYMGNIKMGHLSMGSTTIKEAYIGSRCVYTTGSVSPNSTPAQNKE